jgi:hypothetical protein
MKLWWYSTKDIWYAFGIIVLVYFVSWLIWG